MTEGRDIIRRIVAGTATDEDRAKLQHISAEKAKSMIRPKMKDILDRQKRRNVLRPAKRKETVE